MPDGYGTYTTDKLKAATGVQSNEVSHHAPSGAGTGNVSTPDFMTSKVGMPYQPSDSPPLSWIYKAEPISMPAVFNPGNVFTVRLYADVGLFGYTGSGDQSYYAEQILQRSAITNVNTSNVTLQSKTPGTGQPVGFHDELAWVDYVFEIDGYDSGVVEFTVNDPMNHEAGGMGQVLVLSDKDNTGTPIDGINGDGTVDLKTSTPQWDYLEVTYQTTQEENIICDVYARFYDPTDNVAESNRLYELVVGGQVIEDSPPSNNDTVSWGQRTGRPGSRAEWSRKYLHDQVQAGLDGECGGRPYPYRDMG